MELVWQNRRRLQGLLFAIHLQLPLYLHCLLILLLSIMVILLGTITFTRLLPPPLNPFAAYTDLMADGSTTAEFWSSYEKPSRAAFDLACTTSLTQKICLYEAESGPFAFIKFIDLKYEGESDIYFAVRHNALTVGNVARLWGRPTITRHENSLVLHWPDQHMSTLVHSNNGQFSYHLPVPYLLIRRPP